MANQLAFSLVKQLILALAPENMSFLSESKKYTISEFQESQELKKLIQPADIIITRTPGPLHSSIRKIYNMTYDHLSIVIDSENILHIAPPKVRLLSSNVLLMLKKQPLILRMNISNEEKALLLKELLKYSGEDYSYVRILKLSGSVLLYKIIGQEQTFHKRILKDNQNSKQIICSDLIMYASMDCSAKIRSFIEKNFEKLDVSRYGSFSPDDLQSLSELPDTFLQKVYAAPLLNTLDYNPNESKLKIYSDKIVNNIQLVKRIRQMIRENSDIKDKFVTLLKIVKYLAIYEMIPFQKELIFRLIPLNKRIVEFVLLYFQFRELYRDNSKYTIQKRVIKRLFPVLFLVGNKILGKEELEVLLRKLEDISNDKFVKMAASVMRLKGKL